MTTEKNERGVAYEGRVAWYVRGHQKMTEMHVVQLHKKMWPFSLRQKTPEGRLGIISGHNPYTYLSHAHS